MLSAVVKPSSTLLCLALSLGASCAPPRPVSVSARSPAAEADFSARVPDEATWRALAATPGRQVMARTEVVKVVVDLEDDMAVYFLQSRRWPIHYFFARRFLSTAERPVEDHATFNILQYRRPERRFVLGTLTRYRDQDVWAFELVAGDTLDVPRTARVFEAVRRRVFFAEALRYHPVPPAHERALDAFREASVPVVTTQQLFGAVRYQPVNPGEAYGYLRFVVGEVSPAQVRRTDIVVLDEVPLDLPVCAGIITGQLQAPLGHVAVLATNRRTPDMALRGAFRDPALRALEGRLVRLRVTPQEYSVTPASQAAAERAWEASRPREVMTPPLREHSDALVEISRVRYRDVGVVGAKAAQLGELASIGEGITVPRAFAIPFRAYRDHLWRHHIDAALRDAMAREDFRADPQVRQRVLAELRGRIEAAPLTRELLAAVRAEVDGRLRGERVRLRSSTNAEDLPGFNGAGLYRSVVISRRATDAQLADAVRAVWASTWNLQAYEERAYFRVDQSRVAMAVLVQESVDDDVVDGVAITANPFNEARPGLFINAQVAGAEGASVTSARGDEVPEQVLYYTYGEEGEFERISRSSRVAEGQTVLTDPEVLQLARALRRIHQHYNGIESWERETPMDVEFLLAGAERRLVFVQARPYAVRYDFDRGVVAPPGE